MALPGRLSDYQTVFKQFKQYDSGLEDTLCLGVVVRGCVSECFWGFILFYFLIKGMGIGFIYYVHYFDSLWGVKSI